MSQFMGTTSGTAGVGIQCCPNDIRLMPQYMFLDPFVVKNVSWSIFMGYDTAWWPGSRLDASGNEMLVAVNPIGGEVVEPANGGSNSRFGIQGVTRDVYGSPLGGVLVKLFRTSDDVKVDQIVSDPSGNYLVSTPYYPDAHYLVEYKAGFPDVFGSSVNTLIGA